MNVQPLRREPDFPALGGRTRLVALAPLELGGPDVECLTSYLVRLAAAHCISPRDLARRVLPEAVRGLPTVDAAFLRAHSHSVDGLGKYAALLVDGLQQLTGRADLERLTLLPLTGLLPRNGSSLLASRPRWCPLCLAESLGAREPYRRLVWRVLLYRACHVHGVLLLDKCVSCGQQQPVIPRRPSLIHCDHCGRRLIDAQRDVAQPAASEKLAAQHIADLITISADNRGLDLRAALLQSLLKLVDRDAESNRAAWCRALGFQPRMLNNWVRRGERPSLALLLRLCDALGVGPSALLRDSSELTRSRCVPMRALPKRRRVPVTVRQDIERMLAARECGDALPLTVIAQRYRVSRGYLAHWFSPLLKERRHRLQLARATKRQLREAARAAAIEASLRAIEEKPSRKRLERELVARGFSTRDKTTRAAVRKVAVQVKPAPTKKTP